MRKVTAAWTIQGDRYEGKGFRAIDMKARGLGFEQREESKRCSDVFANGKKVLLSMESKRVWAF